MCGMVWKSLFEVWMISCSSYVMMILSCVVWKFVVSALGDGRVVEWFK